MEYAIAVLERVRARLAALPKPDERNKKLSKQDSVGFLAKDLAASLRNGHTIEEIASVLAAEGVEMSPVALKSYLQRSRSARRKRARKDRGSSERPSTPTPGDASPGVQTGSGNAAPGSTSVGSAGRPSAMPPAPSKHVAGSKGLSVPTRDRDDL
jgi:hypothetical protein